MTQHAAFGVSGRVEKEFASGMATSPGAAAGSTRGEALAAPLNMVETSDLDRLKRGHPWTQRARGNEMGSQLMFKVPAIPAVTELVQVSLKMLLAELVACAEQKSFCMGNDQTNARQLRILKIIWDVSHLNRVPELHYDIMGLPAIAAKLLSWRFRLNLRSDDWFESIEGGTLNHLHD